MLFNSYSFILLFLPAAALLFHALARYGLHRAAFAALTLASLFFYGWWSLHGLALLLVLMLVNYGFARLLIAYRSGPRRPAKYLLAAALFFNLAVLFYFKYANFFLSQADLLLHRHWHGFDVILPLGISFFTFQKIALLVDAYKGKVERLDWLDYALFVSFFPQLIAGPIVHHSEVMPQFRERKRVGLELIGQGLAIFTIGLTKKVVLADTLAGFVTPVFDAAQSGPISFGDGWTAALAYTLQLYFDFSGYSEMAIGCALLFGVRLPLNFASPYKARSIIEFWRRWHMTLSRFLRDYLYFPLGGNRLGPLRRYQNLFLTMLLGGLWHGAGRTFIVWGALHGIYLIVNHLWRALAGTRDILVMRVLAWPLTFLAVVFAWVIFRADTLSAAAAILSGMTGLHGLRGETILHTTDALMFIVPLLAFVWLAPNTQTLTGYNPASTNSSRTRPRWVMHWPGIGAVAAGALFAYSFLSMSKVTEFLYFQF